MASSSSGAQDRGCGCGPAAAPAAAAATAGAGAQHVPRTAGAKCKMCRAKSRFGFLRSQRSLDLGTAAPRSKEAEAKAAGAARVTVGRRARSAERYDGLRVNERSAIAVATRPAPVTSNTSAAVDRPVNYVYTEMPPITSPPPTYEVAVGKQGHLPSYEESQRHRKKQLAAALSPVRSTTPPPPWSLTAASPSQLAAPAAAHPQLPAAVCTCSKCKGAVRGGLRVSLPAQGEERDRGVLTDTHRPLRVALPPEGIQQHAQQQLASSSSSHEHCPCRKCQARYGNYTDSSGDVLLSLDTATAMQGVLTDGVALCDVM